MDEAGLRGLSRKLSRLAVAVLIWPLASLEADADSILVTGLEDTVTCERSPVVGRSGESGVVRLAALREAICYANSNPGRDVIRFQTSGGITLQSPLPPLSDDSGGTTIAGNRKITLDGSLLELRGSGLHIVSSNNVIDGITIINFPEHGVFIEGQAARGNGIYWCLIGSDGSIAMPNSGTGVLITDGASENIIGGESVEFGNNISGNKQDGIVIENASNNNIIAGNIVGADDSMEIAIPNFGGFVDNGGTTGISGGRGIRLSESHGNIIGGSAGRGNFISGNHTTAIRIALSSQNIIQGNTIQTDTKPENILYPAFNFEGILVLSSSHNKVGGVLPGEGNIFDGYWNGDGIRISQSFDNEVYGNVFPAGPIFEVNVHHAGICLILSGGNRIGGHVPGAGNVIEGRGGRGILVNSPRVSGNPIFGNSIYGNVLTPIDNLGLINELPEINSLGLLSGIASPCGSVDFFADDACESEFFLGFTETDGCGNFRSDIDLTPYIGLNLTATATDAAGNTSELSAPIAITAEALGAEAEGALEGEGNVDATEACFCTPLFHSADPDADNAISLNELLRTIQFYRFAEYHCDAAAEDGYGLGAGDRGCRPHTADYAPQDWRVSLGELLRTIQFYNSGGYSFCPGADTEDGYCPGK